jgi:hypothetical protein
MQSVRHEDPKQAEAQAKLDYRWLLEDPRGRRIVRDWLRWSGVEDTGPVEGIEAMACAAGRRMVGNLLRATLRKHDPEGWVRLEAEHVQELVLLAERQAKSDDRRAEEDGA